MSDFTLMRSVLAAQRHHAFGIVEGLDADQIDRAMLPSNWTFRSMVAHLALGDRFWFGAVVGGDPQLVAELEADPDGWALDDRLSPDELLEVCRAEAVAAEAVLDRVDADAPPAWWPGDIFGSWRLHSVAEVIMHQVVEIACHAGHLDAARELLDGRQWLVLDVHGEQAP